VRRIVDVGVGVLIGLVAGLFISTLRSRSDVKPDPQPERPVKSVVSGSALDARADRTQSQTGPTSDETQSRTAQIQTEAESAIEQYEPKHASPFRTKPPTTDEERAQLLAILRTGPEKERLDAAQRLKISVLDSDNGDPISRQGLEDAIQNDPSPQVRKELLYCFWCLPDRGFEIYLNRLVNDPSDEVKRAAIDVLTFMTPGVYYTKLGRSKMSDQFTTEQLKDIAALRRTQVIETLSRVAGNTESIRAYATYARIRLQEVSKSR